MYVSPIAASICLFTCRGECRVSHTRRSFLYVCVCLCVYRYRYIYIYIYIYIYMYSQANVLTLCVFAERLKSTEQAVRKLRKELAILPVFKQIDTLAAEFPAQVWLSLIISKRKQVEKKTGLFMILLTVMCEHPSCFCTYSKLPLHGFQGNGHVSSNPVSEKLP
jgi:hypothetical protein